MFKKCYTSQAATLNASLLCFLDDSGSHRLKSCRYRDKVKNYIDCHNEAGKSILKAIAKGTDGNNVIIADPGTEQIVQKMGAFSTSLPH